MRAAMEPEPEPQPEPEPEPEQQPQQQRRGGGRKRVKTGTQRHGAGPSSLSYDLIVPPGAATEGRPLPRPVLLLRGARSEGSLPFSGDGPRLWNGLVAQSDRVVVVPFFNHTREIGTLARGETASFGFLRRGLIDLLSQISTQLCGGACFQVIAESNGGVLAYALARQCPTLIGSLLILSSAPSDEELRLLPAALADQGADGGGESCRCRCLPISAFVSAKDSAFLPRAKALQAALTRVGVQPSPSLTVVKKKGFVHGGCEQAVGCEILFDVLRAQSAALDGDNAQERTALRSGTSVPVASPTPPEEPSYGVAPKDD